MTVENERLKKIIRKLRAENLLLKSQLQAEHQTIHWDALPKRSVETQTDIRTRTMISTRPAATSSDVNNRLDKAEQLSRMMNLHSNLMKRHDKEVETNMQHVETIQTLTLQINELEEKLRVAHIRQTEAPKNVCQELAATNGATTIVCQHRRQLELATAERDKLATKYRRVKAELSQLNPAFFEEIEDLKFALQQSAILNKEYENALRRICLQFGLPYPHPEQLMNANA